MAYTLYPSIPQTTPNVPAGPAAGPSTGAAGVAALLSGIGGAAASLPGKYGVIGGLLSPFLNLPGQALAYQSQLENTEYQRQQKDRALDLWAGYKPYVSRPEEYNVDVRVPYVAEAMRVASAYGDQGRRASEEQQAKLQSEGRLTDASIAQAVDDTRRGFEDRRRQDVTSLFEQATKEYIANKLRIGDAEMQRSTINAKLPGDVRSALSSILLSDTPTVTNLGWMNAMEDDIRWYQERQEREKDRQTQEDIADSQAQAALWGSGIGAIGDVAGAGLYSYGLNKRK